MLTNKRNMPAKYHLLCTVRVIKAASDKVIIYDAPLLQCPSYALLGRVTSCALLGLITFYALLRSVTSYALLRSVTSYVLLRSVASYALFSLRNILRAVLSA